MCLKNFESKQRDTLTWIANYVLAAAVITAGLSMAWAQARSTVPATAAADAGELRLEKLENDFWICDFVATTRGATFTPIDICAAVTEHLKNEKFRGDYEEMVKWWRVNKAAEHLKIQTNEKR